MRGYWDGFTACLNEGGGSGPSESQSFGAPSSQREGIDWIGVCNNLQSALLSSCDVLVNSDNTLRCPLIFF